MANMVTVGGREVVYHGVVICASDSTGVDLEFVYGGQTRNFTILFCSTYNGPSGVKIHVHQVYRYTSILFAGWGLNAEETILDPPERFRDTDGQQFEIAVAHRKIGNAHRAAIQIVAV